MNEYVCCHPLVCSHTYLVEWKRENVRGHVFLSVRVIYLLDPLIIHTYDAQIKFLNAQNVPQRVNVSAQSGAAKRHHLLEVPQYYSHFKNTRKNRKHVFKKSRRIGKRPE